ncbi:cilia- and flagella-associated protein 43-like isoform X2 [Lytechinus variegatus]|uniref:cilia- and flagella-associated protein 43-like isoform X2 n=1 Tax=Lytechinus variegatus TaxID=7654 RepID=UPI001BB2AD2E|nr:cilia- and flagella-associated protein 43-like isoform X2 [Lytechinus variegatus]
MDSVGTLDVKWAQGYNGSQASFVNKNTLCHVCGNNIKFIDITNNKETVFPSPGDGVGALAVSGTQHLIAFSEMCLNPRIFVYSYPSLAKRAECKGGAKLEYSAIALSYTHPYMVSCSGIPEFSVFLWNWESGQLLVTEMMNGLSATQVSFNPTDWHKLCVVGPKQLNVWTIEQADTMYHLTPSKFTLPYENGPDATTPHPRLPSRAASHYTAIPYDLELDDAAVAGLVGDLAVDFDAGIFDENSRKVVPASHCWTPTGDLFCGCQEGQLLKVDTELNHIRTLARPTASTTSLRREVSLLSTLDKRMPSMPEDGEDKSVNPGSVLTEGSMAALALHRDGLFCGGDDGILRCLDITKNVVQVQDSFTIGCPISSLGWSTTYTKLAVGSSKGSIHMYDHTNPGTAEPVVESHFGNFVGVSVLAPGTTHCVSVRVNGEVQIWSLEDSRVIGSVSVNTTASCIAASPSSSTVAVGTLSGHICFVDASRMEQPRVVKKHHVHRMPVNHISYDTEGRFLFSAGEDGHIIATDARPSTEFKILAQTPVTGNVVSIATSIDEKRGPVKVVALLNTDSSVNTGADKLVAFDVPGNLADDLSNLLASPNCDFKEDIVKKMVLTLPSQAMSVAVGSGGEVYTLSINKQIQKMTLPKEPPKQNNVQACQLQSEADYPVHDLAGGTLLLSYHKRWLLSASPDGKMTIRSTDAMENPFNIHCHSFQTGGVHRMCLTQDATQVLTTGAQDGTMTCYAWNFNSMGKTKANSAIEAARSHKSMLQAVRKREDEVLQSMRDWSPHSLVGSRTASHEHISSSNENMTIEKAIESDQIYMTPTPTLTGDPAWMDVKELEALHDEDKQYATVKKDLRGEIRDLRRMIQDMMKVNETLPDIEKLGHDEFNLDTEEQHRLQAEGEAQVQQIREEMELEDLAKMYMRETIKNECWDSMINKGRSIKAFHFPLEVSNYPMRERSKEEKEELEFVSNMRRIEVAEMAARKEIIELGAQKDASGENEEGDEESEEGESAGDPAAITGSLGSQYGGANDLFYSQFELHTRQQKNNQIVLLQDAIYRIKQTYNKIFDEVYKQREQEIARIEEKNVRITKILDDLASSEEIWQPVMDADEKPEKLLTVEDSEVTGEKFISAEQQAKMDEEARLEEEKKLAAKGDNARERALDMMMGGVLEIKKEDELKKDIPVPIFMTVKGSEEWSDEEKKIAAEYEKKVKELNEEREKYKKTLEAELKKLQTIIADTTANFDEKLMTLFAKKVKTELALFQEELKILRLSRVLMVEDELDAREEELTRLLTSKKALKATSVTSMAQAKKQVEQYRDTYDIRVAEDKVMEKNFRKEFHDVHPVLVDQLFKLYRRRPRGQKHARKSSLTADTPAQAAANPYGERPLSARQPNTTAAMVKALDELNDESHMPEGVEPHTWRHMCDLRKAKVISEQEVKAHALTLADMNGYLQRRQEEDERLRGDIDDLLDALNRLREERLRFTCNLEVQLVLKQGQVEVNVDEFIADFDDSVLLHRSVVEDLNASIRQLGELKITAMKESKDFRKGIHVLEWEHKKMIMQIEDLLEKAKVIQMLKVSRELQGFLHNEDHEGKKQQQIQTLEHTLENQRAHHDKTVGERKQTISKLKHVIRQKEVDNATLDRELEEMTVMVSERKHINNVNAAARSDTGSAKRMQDIVQRRKLVDLAKAQAQEVAVLRAEVERLRMRTFPALVQVER